ncbi:hypothetical protein [Nonomuraea sp. NPDC003201]
MSLPDFLIADVPKAGTTALRSALQQHPELYLSTAKEPKFFLTDGPPPARGGPAALPEPVEALLQRRGPARRPLSWEQRRRPVRGHRAGHGR